MQYRLHLVVMLCSVFAAARIAAAQCPDCPVKGGGSTTTDCHVELASDVLHANYPFYPKKSKEIRCFDGDPCDLDGIANNSCTFDVNVCLHNADPSLPDCVPATVTAVTVSDVEKFPELAALQADATALVPASTNVCTTGDTVTVPLEGPDDNGVYKATKFSMKVATEGGKDKDKYKFLCVPRGWPSHGYDNANTRATPLDTGIQASNVSTLVEKWRFEVPGGTSAHPVTSTVTVGASMVYTSAWDAKIYALDKNTGAIKWSFNTHATLGGLAKGIQSSVTLTADGRVLAGDSNGQLWCLDGKKGTLIWHADAGAQDPEAAHAWASPTIVNSSMVLMGIASHNDAPCTRGTLIAYDLNTGVERWRQHTVPERICYDDTSNECTGNSDCATPESPCLVGKCDSNYATTCTTNSDCPATFLTPGVCVAPAPATTGECWLERSITCSTNADCPSCVPGVGGGVTATPATSSDGHDVYMASVGCLSRPSIGNSDSIFKLDAATGDIQWVYRTESPEQFTGPGATYHDYGFLNGPILVNNGTPLAVAGGKDGAIYAVNQTTGLLEWSNVLSPAPPFAGFGLFNGAEAYDAQTDQFFGALDGSTTYATTNDHLMSFNRSNGATGWSELPGSTNSSWSSLTIANDILYAGTSAHSRLDAYNKATGAFLASLPVPAGQVTGGAAVENGVIYIPYGVIYVTGQGGVIAYQLPTP